MLCQQQGTSIQRKFFALKKLLQDNGLWVLIASLLLTSALTLGSALMPNLTSPVTNLLLTVTSPFQYATTSVTSRVKNVYDYAFRYQQLEEKLAKTEQELLETREHLRAVQDAIQENADLRSALNLVERNPTLTLLDVVATQENTTSWESTLTLNKGSADGIKVNDCVISGTGCLVGIVTEVGSHWARLITMIDPNISISATVYRTGDTTILESDLSMMQNGTCKLTYLKDDITLTNGDEIMTNGSNGTYPAGLTIGYVQSIQPSPSGLEKIATVTPAASLDSLGTLFVITSFANE